MTQRISAQPLAYLLPVILLAAAGCAPLRTVGRPGVPLSVPLVELSQKRVATIRVALARDLDRVSLGSAGEVKIYNMRTRKNLGTMRLGDNSQAVPKSGSIVLDGRDLSTDRIRVLPRSDASVQVSGRSYRGQIDVALEPENGKLRVVNYLSLEDYLKGVVPNEVPSTWLPAALQAQAVASRTFALYKMSGRERQPYDLDASVNSQVYRGQDSEKETSNQAVDATRGMVAVYQDRPIAAFYHSNCGGTTADVKDVWGSDIGYLHDSACGFCEDGPHARWTATLTKDEIRLRLRRHNVAVGRIDTLELQGMDPSGRVRSVVIRHAGGTETLKASLFRLILGSDVIRSTNFSIRDGGGTVTVTGRGWGHGVGLCQEGAQGMAVAGYGFADILRHYYPGVELKRIQP